jgi:undecaprenyl diphosphate synthase
MLSPPLPRRYLELSAAERSVYDRLDRARIPQHVAIIMDGNGRWAGKRRLARFFGHSQGAEAVQFVVETAARMDLPWLTLYAFSVENNLRRPKDEVNFLMKLLDRYLVKNVQRMNDNNVRIAYIGRTSELPAGVQKTMQWASEATAKNTGTTLTLALNYGARGEILDSFRSLMQKEMAAGRSFDEILQSLDEPQFSRHLYTAHMPDPDLVIRTSGELRISNFLLWQIAYSEMFVTDRMWPDFTGIHLLEAIEEYQRRDRRFGGINTKVTSDESAEPSPDAAAVLAANSSSL